MKFFFVILLTVMVIPLHALPDGVYWTPVPGKGYMITHLATGTRTLVGTEIKNQAILSYETRTSDGKVNHWRQATNECIVTVSKSVEVKEWVYHVTPNIDCVVDIANCGEGGIEINGPLFTIYVLVPNDGQQHRFTWYSILKGTMVAF